MDRHTEVIDNKNHVAVIENQRLDTLVMIPIDIPLGKLIERSLKTVFLTIGHRNHLKDKTITLLLDEDSILNTFHV